MPYVSQITLGDGEVHIIESHPDRTLIGIDLPAMVGESSYAGFVNNPEDTFGFALIEDGQTIINELGGSRPEKEHMIKAFGEEITFEILQEWSV